MPVRGKVKPEKEKKRRSDLCIESHSAIIASGNRRISSAIVEYDVTRREAKKIQNFMPLRTEKHD